MTTMSQPTFAGGELSRALWARYDLGKYSTGLAECLNCFVHPHGGVSNRAGLEFVNEAHDSANAVRLIEFEFSTTQTYILEFGENYMRVVKDGAMVLNAAQSITGITQADPAVVEIAGHGYANDTVVYIIGVTGMTEVNGRFFRIDNVAADTFELVGVDSTGYGAYTSGGSSADVYMISTPYSGTDLAELKYTQSADTMSLFHPLYQERTLTRTDHNAWTLAAFSVGTSATTPTGVTATATTGSGTLGYSYIVTSIDEDTGQESLPSTAATCTNNLGVSPNTNQINWTAVTGAERYNIYKQDNLGVHGYIGSSTGTSFADRNIMPDYTDSPPGDADPFAGAGNYPVTGTYYQQRAVRGGSVNKPQGLEMSQTGNFNNFNHATPRKADDAISITMASLKVNAIRHMVPLEDLLVFTSGGEWAISSNGDIFSAETIRNSQQGYRGSSNVAPIIVGNTVLFVQARGNIVRDLAYTLSSDSSVSGYVGNDLTILSRHLFKGHTIVDWTYSQSPDSIIWAVRSDGIMLGLTYLREHEVWAWHQHATDGLFESVSSVPEGDEDAVYAVVRRTINGQSKRYIERLHSRIDSTLEDSFFVDSGLTYEGEATSVLTGLEHLEGEVVSVLADGNVHPQVTVAGGQITLQNNYAKVHVGLPYVSRIRTLPIYAQMRDGSTQGRRKNVDKVTIQVENTRGVWVGPALDKLVQKKPTSPAVYGGVRPSENEQIDISIRPDWNDSGQFYVQQTDPLPITLLALIPEVAVGG